MKNLFKNALFLVCIFSFIQCEKEITIPENIVVQDFIWKSLNAYYLYQDQIPDLSDRRFNSDQELNNYLNGFADNQILFNSLLIPTDKNSNLILDYTNLNINLPRTAFTNGMEFIAIEQPNNTDNIIGIVSHILPNSNASNKNIRRGEFFNSVNGTILTKTNFENLLITNTNPFNLGMVNFDGVNITANGKVVSLEKENYNYPTALLEKTFALGATNIGYLLFANDFSENSIEALNNSFLAFKNQAVNELILDLRYNISGSETETNISYLAALITGQFAAEPLIKKEWNAKAQRWFLDNEPEALVTNFPTQIAERDNLNSLNLNNVYLILNGENFDGSSGIELLINSLKPYINVEIIGTNTAGNPNGIITLYNSEDYNFANRNTTHTIATQPTVLSFTNNNDQSFIDGFTPNITTCTNEDILNLGELGERTEPILDRVLTYISTGNSGVNFNCNPNNYEFIYNSLDAQRLLDNGVLITQNLPNTN